MELRGSAGAQRRLSEIQSQLLTARHAVRLPQQALSDLVGVASRTLRDWEKGYDTPNLRHLITWAHTLGFRLVIVDPLGSLDLSPPVAEIGESLELHEMRRLAQPLERSRRARELSQGDLALLLGVSRSTVQRWEDAEKFPRPVALIAWASRLKCSVKLDRVSMEYGDRLDPGREEA